MAELLTALPAPRHQFTTRPTAPALPQLAAPAPQAIPPYGQRASFRPVTIEDFGDGGAFPEVHLLQYPLDMGRPGAKSSGRTTQLQVDEEGNVRYDMIVHQNQRRDVVVHSQYKDMVEKDVAESTLERPSEDEELKTAERTRAALGQIVSAKLSSAQPTHVAAAKQAEPVFVRYTPSNQVGSHNSGAQQRIIRLQEMPVDPLEPPKFKHKKVPGGPPSPPVPVMHSPPRKVTAADMANWKIPPCISNWKNIKGYTIPLDKRLAADGRGLQEPTINDRFAKLSESLFMAERVARSEIEKRAQVQKQVLRKQKEAKEGELRDLAAKARAAGLARTGAGDREVESTEDVPMGGEGEGGYGETEEEAADRRAQRDELRREMKRELRRELRMEAMSEEKKAAKKTFAARDQERDVSEKIALGQSVQASKEGLFDQRLFNQAQGMDSGFKDDDAYDLYDKPLFNKSQATYIYRGKDEGKDLMGEEDADERVAKLLEKGTGKFVPDKGFKGTEDAGPGPSQRQKPVEFEKSATDDPFNIAELVSQDKGRKRGTLDGIGKQGHMSASAGGGLGSLGSGGGSHDPHRRAMEFTEGSSFSSSSSRSDRDRDRSYRERERSRSRSRDRESRRDRDRESGSRRRRDDSDDEGRSSKRRRRD